MSNVTRGRYSVLIAVIAIETVALFFLTAILLTSKGNLPSIGKAPSAQSGMERFIYHRYDTDHATRELAFTAACRHLDTDRVHFQGSGLAPNNQGVVHRVWFSGIMSRDQFERSSISSVSLEDCREIYVSSCGPTDNDPLLQN